MLSEDILGLADLDKIERRKPHVFKSLEAFDPAEIHRQVIHKAVAVLTDEDTAKLASFLVESSRPSQSREVG